MSSPQVSLAVALPMAVGVASLALLAYALRGRRVDDHPICRRCGFDLFGSPPGRGVCSECGEDTTGRRAVRVGRRVKRTRLVLAAVPLLVMCAAWLAAVAWVRARGVDVNRYKPAAWLARDARGANPAARDAALAEFTRRVARGTLPDSRVAELTDAALEHQADAGRPWVQGWGTFVESARDAGRLPDAQWRRYARQAALSTRHLEARPSVRPGEPVPVRLLVRQPRGGASRFQVTQLDDRFELNGRGTAAFEGPQKEWPASRSDRRLLLGLRSTLARDEPRNVAYLWRVSVTDSARGAPVLSETLSVAAVSTATEAETVTLNADPSLRSSVAQSISARCFSNSSPGRGRPEMTIRIARPPVAVAARVFVRGHGGEWHTGAALTTEVSRSNEVTFELPRSAEGAQRVDVVLRPDADLARQTVNLTEIWGEKIVVTGVEVPVRESE